MLVPTLISFLYKQKKNLLSLKFFFFGKEKKKIEKINPSVATPHTPSHWHQLSRAQKI